MSLKRDIKYGVHTGTSITKIIFGISELIAILIAFILAYNWVIIGDFAEGITLYLNFVVWFLLQQIWALPVTMLVDWLHNISKP